jgi:prophage regulatory protein
MSTEEEKPQIKIVRPSALTSRLGISRSKLERLRRRDPSFPAPIALGVGRRCAIAWYEVEVEAWLGNRPRVNPDGALAPVEQVTT